jgi:hypothetical protein
MQSQRTSNSKELTLPVKSREVSSKYSLNPDIKDSFGSSRTGEPLDEKEMDDMLISNDNTEDNILF